jgi:DNA-directed RNA polymerase subunit M/transcription elongation factor TFIIS
MTSATETRLSAQEFFLQKKLDKTRQTKQLCRLLDEPVEFKDASSKCEDCGLFTVRFRLAQTRGRDECETAKFICSNCNET